MTTTTSTLTLTASGTAATGTAAVTITGNGGGLTRTTTLNLTVTAAANQAPTVATPAGASPNPVTGATTALSALGADDGGEAALTYTWSATGPAPVTFSANGTNAAKNTTATFTQAGAYTFQVVITDAQGLTATSTVSVTVNQTTTAITVSPASASVSTGGTQQFTALATDQFGNALSAQPTFTWTVNGGGTIDNSGLFTAGSTANGPYTVTAAAGKSGTASVTVTTVDDLATYATGSGKITLYWSGVPSASGYNVYRGTTSGGEDYTQPINGSTPVTTQDAGPGVTNMFEFSDTGLMNGQEYFYTVKAVYASGESVASNEDSNVPSPESIPWDTGDPSQIVQGMTRLLTNTLPPDDFSDPYTPDIGFLSIGGPDGVIYQGNIPDGSAPRAVAASGHYNASTGAIDYSDGSSLPAPSDGDDGVSSQAAPSNATGMQPYVVQNPPVYGYPAYTPNPTGIYRKVETQPGYSGFRALVGLPLPGDSGLVLNTSGSKQDAAYIYTGGSLYPTPGQNYRGGSSLALDVGLQLGHSDPTTNPGWVPFIFYKGGALQSEIVDGSSPSSGDKVFIKGDSLDEERMFLYTSGSLSPGATSSAQSVVTDNLIVLRLVGPYVYRKHITTGFDQDSNHNGAVTCTYYASGWGKFYPRSGGQGPFVPKTFVLKRCNSIAQNLNNPRTRPTPLAGSGLVNPNGPPSAAATQAGFYTSGSSVIGADWGTADDQSVTIFGSGGWVPWQDGETFTDAQGHIHSGSYPALNRYVDWLDQNDFFWETNISLQTRQ